MVLNFEQHAIMTFQHVSNWNLKEKLLIYSNGKYLGKIQQPILAHFKRILYVLNSNDEHVYTIYSPMLHPHYFYIEDLATKECVAKIQRKWSDLGESSAGDDMFCFKFYAQRIKNLGSMERSLIFASVFMVIQAYFEHSKKKKREKND